MSVTTVLCDIVTALDQAHIPHMLTGSFGAAYHGASRATMDVDLVIDATPAQLRSLVDQLPGPDYYVSLEAAIEDRQQESLFYVIHLPSGWRVDPIIRKSRPFSMTEFERRTPAEWEGVRLGVATLEDIILAKLEWARLAESARQLEDVAALLRVAGPHLDYAYLERWLDAVWVRGMWETVRGSDSPRGRSSV